MHAIELSCTDASTPETAAATTVLKLDGNEITGVRKMQLKWERGGLPIVVLEIEPGPLTISNKADVTLTLAPANFAGDKFETRGD